jgi:ATP-dependent HslUV protease subunit HslV
VGSGAPYALAAARALLRHTELDAAAICREAMTVAGEICIYSNDRVTLLEIEGGPA